MQAIRIVAIPLIIINGIALQSNGLSTIQLAGQSDKKIAVFFEKGARQHSNGAYLSALELLSVALRLAETMHLPVVQAKCLQKLGTVAWDLGRVKESSELFTAALALARKVQDSSGERFCSRATETIKLYNQGKELRASVQPANSLARFDDAIGLALEIGSEDLELKCLRQKSLTYWQLDRFNEFLACNCKALSIAYKLKHEIEKGRCLNNIGLYYEREGQFSRALVYLEEGRKILSAQGDFESEAECLNNIGLVYKEVGDYEKALRTFGRAHFLDSQSGNNVSILKDLNNISSMNIMIGLQGHDKEQFEKALNALRECLTLQGDNGDDLAEIAIFNNIGIAYYGLGEYEKAVTFYLRALRNKAIERHHGERLHILNNVADAYFMNGELDKARSVLSNSIGLVKRLESPEGTWATFFELGRCCEAKGEFIGAWANFKKSIDCIDETRAKIGFDPFKIGFIHNKLAVYQHAISVLFSLYSSNRSNALLNDIFVTIEKAKARAFVETLHEARTNVDQPGGPSERAERPEASKKISSAFRDLMMHKIQPQERLDLERELKDNEERSLRLVPVAIGGEEHVLDKALPETCSIPKAQTALLGGRMAILEYWLSEQKSLLLLITKNQAKLFELPSSDTIENSLRGFLRLLRAPNERLFTGVSAAYRIANELLPPPYDPVWAQVDYMIVVPDGILHCLPFESLQIRRNDKDVYLVEKLKISYSPSVSSLILLNDTPRMPKPRKDLLAFGAPNYHTGRSGPDRDKNDKELIQKVYAMDGFSLPELPYSAKEIREIAKHFPPSAVDIFLRDKANESELKRLDLNEYRIIHFACHGFLDDRFPLRSALVLSLNDKEEEDGFVQAREICNLRMNADLVVLSACQTANGALEKVEGLMGLPRFFFYAGAKSVLSSLWPIGDRTSCALMKDFYGFLSRGYDKSTALQLAKINLLKSSYSHPFYWAAFVLSGDPSPIYYQYQGYDALAAPDLLQRKSGKSGILPSSHPANRR